MNIIKTLPYTPNELAILKEKHSDVLIETIVGTFGVFFMGAIFSVIPGKHGRPPLYENATKEAWIFFAVAVCTGAIVMYFFNRYSIGNDIKNGQKTVATIEVWQKIMGLNGYIVFTKEEKPFKSFNVSKNIYDKMRKGDLITIEFAYFTRTVFYIKMPY